MPAKINITICSGDLIAATQEIVQERLEEFAAAHRRVKELDVSVDVGNSARPVVEIKVPIGEQEFVGKASADNVVQAVDDAIRRLQGKLAERLEERKEQSQDSEDRDNTLLMVGVGILVVLLAGIVGFSLLRSNDGLNVVDVKVIVNYEGEPLEAATVIFASKTGGSLSSGAMATGITDSKGRPKMMTQVSPKTAAAGLVPDTYKVTISKLVPPDGMSDQEYQQLVETNMEAANKGLIPDSPLPDMVCSC